MFWEKFGKETMPLFLLFAVSFSALPALGKYGGGTGEPNDPYLIFDANQMNEIGLHEEDWASHFKLMADIDLSGYTGTEFNIIGNGHYECDPPPICIFVGTPFTGVFDGNGHTISNFTYNSTEIDHIGLFGYVDDPNAQIKNLGLVDPNVNAGTGWRVGSLVGRLQNGSITDCNSVGGGVSGNYSVGGLVGYNLGTVSNCYSTGSVSGNMRVGGLVGWNYYGSVSNSYATGSVSGNMRVGGLLGLNSYGTVSNSYSTGSVSGTGYSVGGLLGKNSNGGTVSNCYSAGNISGTGYYVGGLLGSNSDGGTVSNCYSTGSVSGDDYVGGLMGVSSGHIISCFWDVNSSGQPSSAAGTGKTTAEMKDPNTFIGWWCGSAWTIDAGLDYPRLWWENAPGELITTTATYAGGSGEPNDPYLIETAEQLNSIGGLVVCHWDKHFKLTEDIDLGGYTGTSLNIIGTWPSNPFTGVFDGNGHTISNFTYNSTWIGYIGLFGYVDDPNAQIKNLYLIDPNVNGDEVGSLVGRLQNGRITDCNSVGGSVSGDGIVGGLVGTNFGMVSNCYSTGSVSGGGAVGGLVGYNYAGTVSNSYASGSVSGGGAVGGLVGFNDGTVRNSYATGNVSGDEDVGGLVGKNYGTLSKSYATGSVSGMGYDVGGLAGTNFGMVSNCYSTGSVSGMGYDVGGLVGKNDGTVSSSNATGSVSGYDYVGGLVGYNATGTVSDSYAAGSVSGNYAVGGLVGWNRSSTVSNSYAVGDVNGITYVGGLVGFGSGNYTKNFWDNTVNPGLNGIGNRSDPDVIGESTVNMQMKSTFTNAGWDFVGEVINGTDDIWRICVDGVDYPGLSWEFPLGDFVCPDGVEMRDFAILGAQWLQPPDKPSIDIAPDGGDGIIDRFDLAELVDNWLIEREVLTPIQASNPYPPDGAGISDLNADLSWSAGCSAISHDIYFGTSNPPPFIQNQSSTTFNPGTMAYNTTYYWRIDEVGHDGTTLGEIWSFTVITPPP